jgi:hypothetical protein
VRLGSWLLIVVPVTILAWWLFNEDPEQEVRGAHAALVRLVGKSADDANSRAILNARAFQSLFVDACEISGEAGRFVDTYSPAELFRTVAAMQSRFDSVQLTFGELAIEFPTSDEAAVSFVATVEGQAVDLEAGSVVETRNVVSRMANVDGDWLFTGFQFTDN